ncbi:DM13 domain-containing protein [Periweissella ghanensis]|uniref:DM13 domain-containing protein n=1 Tax=Periweissella ghanensis TaxID=467997 RepID=A0ABN8BP34_9LACO|nr:DM13 domain-containing protein [Periweissella ghanensis]MCM0600557.1 DM13 domain-containing protein [Periweissella ghanensis]CAH0418360.1 hypothetical protein WGH24286_00778 [Periweissella ghanensis]
MKKSKLIGTLIAVGAAGILLAACGSNAAKSSSSSKSSDAASSMTKTVDTASFTGSLKGDNKMKVSGNVSIKDGKLTLTDFSTAAGPDLHVYLAKGTDPKTGVDLAPISLTKKTQTFSLKGTDVKKYSDVLIYCDKAHALFGHATYNAAADDSATTTDTATTLSGSFKGQNGKQVSGDVTVNGNEIDLSNFKTVAGPDLHIYLSKDGSVDNGAINLGKISLTDANQKIKVPAGTNISDFKQVLIHCDEAHVTFGAADVK